MSGKARPIAAHCKPNEFDAPSSIFSGCKKYNERLNMDKPRVRVDFNDMISSTEVLLSKGGVVIDSAGHETMLYEGASISVYDDDANDAGQKDNLIADGIATVNSQGGWTKAAKWALVIDERGIRHESDSDLG